MESARHLTWKLLNPSFNATDEHAVLPPHPLDLYVPSYRLIRRVGYGFLGIDVSIYLTGLALLFGLYKAARYVYAQIYWLFYRNFTSIVFINESDDLFDMLMRWFAENQHNASYHRSMFAVTKHSSRGQDGYDDGDDDDALGESGLFNYDKWSARIPPRFEHGYGRRSFTHNGTWFWFDRRRRSEDHRGPVVVNNGGEDKDEQIQLDCLGRSIEPIKEFLSDVRLWNSSQRRNHTSIRHPAPKERRHWGGRWIRTTSRPSRPMSTVILDEAQKHKTIEDMNTFLHPSSPRWYAARGIPYRRGYLFHGPPGTGKTSMTFALAGIFGLDIYAISLQDSSLDESGLLQLFNDLPRRCIVLLEDVDAAGLVRDTSEDVVAKKMKKKKEQKKQDDKDNKLDIKAKDNKKQGHAMQTRGAKKNDKKDDEFTLKDFAQEMKSLVSNPFPFGPEPGMRKGRMKRGGRNLDESDNGGGVSLSGLLNAIDGVASPEGQLLIMTTNHPDKLDHALVRPGRVDLRIGFTLAAREELRELFVRMYTPSEESLDAIESSEALQGLKKSNGNVGGSTKTNGHSKLAKKGPKKGPISGTSANHEDRLVDMSQERLEELADEFAAKIPDNTLTPAEVQNLLMQYKTQPSEAVDRVESWLEETFEEKEKQRIAEAEKSDTDDEDEVDEDDEW